MISRRLWSFGLVAVLATGGCKPAFEANFVASEDFAKLEAKQQDIVRQALAEKCGTPAAPKLLSQPDKPVDKLTAGRDLYLKHCQQCHGASGDGNGPAAKHLYPRPRDYRKGIYKFVSTPYGSKPRRADLVATIDRGVPGTSMPSFRLLPKQDRELLIDYVLLLTQRGEYEARLTYETATEGELDKDLIPEMIDGLLGRWKQAEAEEIHPLTPQPFEFTAEMVAAGRAAFLSKGCVKCHGEDGRGQTKDNLFKDGWGQVTKAADLTSGLLHGGYAPIDVYRRIISGINGTPMPGFRTVLQQEPETLWNLTAYVLYVSGQRRAGVSPAPGEFTKVTPESGTAVAPDSPAAATE